jgi:hypothetical protein
MPSNVSKARRRKSFDEGRRSAREVLTENPYDNPTLRRLWERGRTQEQGGQVAGAIPPLGHGETRARCVAPVPPDAPAPLLLPSRSPAGRSPGGRSPRAR